MNKDTNPNPFSDERNISFDDFKSEVLDDYRIACESRHASLLGRREVLTGKAKFGIFGDGKEVAQLAMAKAFREGDFRAGYYRDQTFMFAAGLLTLQQFFAQLYAHPDSEAEPATAGRAMNGHFATRLLDEKGNWKNLTSIKNSSADISPTAGQMPRLLGLAYASKLYRNNQELTTPRFSGFSLDGNEVAFGTIGDASTSEGLFFETINAAGVLQVPMAISVWDDGYGISVPAKYQTTKQNISEILAGFERTEEKDGYFIYTANGWDYPELCEVYQKGIAKCRSLHVPVLFHIREMTQPQGHSTSGSHERYKTKERLAWEDEYDCIAKMKSWMIESSIADSTQLDEIDIQAKKTVSEAKKRAWNAFSNSIRSEFLEALGLVNALISQSENGIFIQKVKSILERTDDFERRDLSVCISKILRLVRNESSDARNQLINWFREWRKTSAHIYDSHQNSESDLAALKVLPVAVRYDEDAHLVDGREVLLANSEALLKAIPELLYFGEDVGSIGGVNQTLAGLQAKFGENRVIDTGIREATIVGQGIGLALRGLRPIAEIQYLDYLAYALQVLTDDLACLQYRTRGGQKAPLIISTRGHRLEGIWHSGSPMSMILGSLRGIHLLVPRNMTQAAGFYNTLLASDEPGIVIEPLNGYRSKEKLPANPGEYRLPLGVPEILVSGHDVTLVTYGSCCRIAQEAVQQLLEAGISCELIDVQSLLPFDISHQIVESLKKTNKIIFIDEDVPGGATAYMMQQVLEVQDGFRYLDAKPVTLAAKEHRPAYGSDGDYFSKPSTEDIYEAVYNLMHGINPDEFPLVF